MAQQSSTSKQRNSKHKPSLPNKALTANPGNKINTTVDGYTSTVTATPHRSGPRACIYIPTHPKPQVYALQIWQDVDLKSCGSRGIRSQHDLMLNIVRNVGIQQMSENRSMYYEECNLTQRQVQIKRIGWHTSSFCFYSELRGPTCSHVFLARADASPCERDM